MDSNDHRTPREQPETHDTALPNGDSLHSSVRSGTSMKTDIMDTDVSGYTLMVAGRRTGKTSFIRLLLDTSTISPTTSQEQLASVAKFIHGSAGYTSHIRSVSVNIELVPGEGEGTQPLNLTLIDTPSFEFSDEAAAQRAVSDILRHVDARFAESMEDERKPYSGDYHVHLCIYFLDPDDIVPPPVSVPSAPLVPRGRNGSVSKPEESVTLEPPVPTNPVLCRPTLSAHDITTIRRLSARVNVLPVIARADTLTNDRLAAVKMAIRRDLAQAGIGFGIFDIDNMGQFPAELPEVVVPKHEQTGFNGHTNGTTSNATSPPSTPISPSILRLPFALISPDIYSHSDGVSRQAPSRHELVLQYTPSHHHNAAPASKCVPGKWMRSYRWGSLDCMDTNHCDFVLLRGAIFHHMKTLQKYTREYLFEKFRAEYQGQHPLLPPPPRGQRSPVMSRLPPLSSHGTRPILAIETHPAGGSRHPSLSVQRGPLNGEAGLHIMSGQSTPMMPELSPKTASSTRQLFSQTSHLQMAEYSHQVGSQRQRAKKITVACNFCRSRKLKCDGGRPACAQCFKRQHPCDYTVNNKRRGNGKRRRSMQDGVSDSEGEADSGDPVEQDPTQSPEVTSLPTSRRNSNARDHILEDNTLPPMNGAMDRRDEPPPMLPPISQSSQLLSHLSSDPRGYMNNDLPPIATLPVTATGSATDMSQQLPPLRSSDAQASTATQRRRTSSAASTKGRPAGYGSKIVACNFCRARKTRCDGGHPSCGSCARRSLPCNYVNDPATSNPKGRPKASVAPAPGGSSSRSSPVNGAPSAYMIQFDINESGDADIPPTKKMRIMDDLKPSASAIAVSQMSMTT